MTLRVAHVLNSPGRGGVPRVVEALIRHADPQRVDAATFFLKADEGTRDFAGANVLCNSPTRPGKAAAMAALVTWLDRHKFDILHTHSFRPNLYARMAGVILKPAGLKIVAHYHNDYSSKWTHETRLMERHLAAHTDAALAVSASVAAHVTDVNGVTPVVLENGLDVERATSGNRAAGRAALSLPPDARVVGLVGRICHQKGVDTFVEAAMRIGKRRSDICFAIVGDIEDRALAARLRNAVAAVGLADRIALAGHHDAVADIYAALDLLAAPSRWEGFGLVLIEAMAAGVPVIASDVGGIPDVAGAAACLIPPDDPAALSGAIEALLSDESLRELLIRSGRARSRHFDWARTADRLMQVYDRVMTR